MATSDGDPPFRALGEEEIWRGWILRLGLARFSAPDGQVFERDILHHPGAVAVVPVHDDATVTLVRQFRPAAGRYLYEIPAGTRDVDGEEPAATARRELTEEAGLTATSVVHLVTVLNSPGFTDQETLIFAARGLAPCPPARSGLEEEWLEVVRLPWATIDELMASGEICDAMTVLGLQLARPAPGGR